MLQAVGIPQSIVRDASWVSILFLLSLGFILSKVQNQKTIEYFPGLSTENITQNVTCTSMWAKQGFTLQSQNRAQIENKQLSKFKHHLA